MILQINIFDECIVIDIDLLNDEVINDIIEIVTPLSKSVTDSHNKCVHRTLCITSNVLYYVLIELTMHYELMVC